MAGPQQSLQEMAAANGVSPQTLYNAMMRAQPAADAQSLKIPDTPPPGTGNLTLSGFSRQYGLEVDILLQSLEAHGLEVRAAMTIKAIAAANKRSPVDIYELLRRAASSPSAG